MYAWIFLLRTRGARQPRPGRASGLPALNLLYNDAAVLLGQVYGELPFMILPLYASLEKLDRVAARSRRRPGRAARARSLRRVDAAPHPARASWPAAILVFIPSLGAYLAPDLLGGARTVYVGSLIQSQFAVARDIPFGAALSFAALRWASCSLLWLFRRPLRRARGAGVTAARARGPSAGALVTPRRLRCSSTRRSLVLVAFSFNQAASPRAGRASPSTGTRRLLRDQRVLAALRNSLIVAAGHHRAGHGRRAPRPPWPSTATASAAQGALGRARGPAPGGARDRAGRLAGPALRGHGPAPGLPHRGAGPRRLLASPTRWWWCARAWPASTAAWRRRPWTWGPSPLAHAAAT